MRNLVLQEKNAAKYEQEKTKKQRNLPTIEGESRHKKTSPILHTLKADLIFQATLTIEVGTSRNFSGPTSDGRRRPTVNGRSNSRTILGQNPTDDGRVDLTSAVEPNFLIMKFLEVKELEYLVGIFLGPNSDGRRRPTVNGRRRPTRTILGQNPTDDDRVDLTSAGSDDIRERGIKPTADGVNVIIMYMMKNYRTEYKEYHEGYNHGAHTHEGYNFGAYDRNDCDERWRYLRSMDAFYGMEAMEINQWLKEEQRQNLTSDDRLPLMPAVGPDDEKNFVGRTLLPTIRLGLSSACSLLNCFLNLFWKNLHQNFLIYHLPSKEIFWKHDLAKEQINTSTEFYGIYWWTRNVSLKFRCLELLIKQLRKCFEDSLKWKREMIWCFLLQFEELFWKFGVANEVQNDDKPFNTNSLTSKRNFLANDVCDLESLLVKTSWILQYISRIFQKHLSRNHEGTLKSVENLSLYYHHLFKETMFQTLDLLNLLFELEKNKSFYYHLSFRDVDFNLFFNLQEFNTFNCASSWRFLVNFEWPLNSLFWSFLALNFFVYTSFSYHRLFKEICYLWNSYGIETLVNKLDALFSYSLLRLERLGNFYGIVPYKASISNVACLLWLFEGMDLMMNPFKRRADGMTRDAQEIIELLQVSITRAMAKRMEEKHRGKIAIFEKMTQDLAWQVTEAQEGAFRGTKTLLLSKLQVEEAKETNLEDLEASKTKNEEVNSTTSGRVPPIVGF
ncbi:hypothetical protein M9H77_23835 [Catharanthus roseus]|uniref:Uncharacterized protein n=1 Tax=Catharanthus roseus TaxID=4058 RepID=A0ACC0AU20_CATRO|nr:hypothetical protein M9H77_23835 [Catharanthus roseus]